VEAARALVAVYSRLLEENTGMLIPASRLPAGKDVFKTALKIAAAADLAAGRLDDVNGRVKLRDAYVVSYAHLADVVPDDFAEHMNRFHESIQKAHDLGDVDATTLAAAIVDPGEGNLERQRATTAEFGRLADEFKTFLAKAEAGMSGQGGSSSGSISLLAEIFPRWKACVLLFVGLTALTVFVPAWLASIVFSICAGFICWRGYRRPGVPAWPDVIGVGPMGLFIGSFLSAIIAAPLQRSGLIRLSRDVHISSAEWFLCCLWDGKSPKSR
jgi:hypothetical protein